MPIFGNKKEFAIEILGEVTKGLGYFCFWCHEIQIGDNSAVINIQYSINWLYDFLNYRERRQIANSENLTKESLFYELYEYIMTDSSDADKHSEYDSFCDLTFDEKRDIFHLDFVGGEAFDVVDVILIDEPLKNRQRMIWRKRQDMSLHEQFLPSGTFDRVAHDMLDYYKKDSFYKRPLAN